MIPISPSIFIGIILGGFMLGLAVVAITTFAFVDLDGPCNFTGRKGLDPFAESLKQALQTKKRLSPDRYRARVNRLSPHVRAGVFAYIDTRIKLEKSPELLQQMEALKVDLMAVESDYGSGAGTE